MSWAVIRSWSPLRRTEPSSTLATCSCRAISGISACLPLNEKDEVRAATLSCGIFESKFSNSSEMPSEKYAWSFACDMSTNGNTAMLLSLDAVSVLFSEVFDAGAKRQRSPPPKARTTAMIRSSVPGNSLHATFTVIPGQDQIDKKTDSPEFAFHHEA